MEGGHRGPSPDQFNVRDEKMNRHSTKAETICALYKYDASEIMAAMKMIRFPDIMIDQDWDAGTTTYIFLSDNSKIVVDGPLVTAG